MRRARIGFWLRAVGSSAPVEAVEQRLGQEPAFRGIAQRWDRSDRAERERAAAELERLFRRAAYDTRPFCLRCGQCCANAGPTLQRSDESCVESGAISLRQLVTYRQGEQVFSHLERRTVRLSHEMVTARSASTGGCALHDRQTRSCSIYEHRPRQCVEQRCWAADESTRLARHDHLRRIDLLPPSSPLLPLIEEHERCCPTQQLAAHVETLRGDQPAAPEALRQLIEEDERLRQRVLDTGAASHDELPFVLGRPVADQLGTAGIRLPDGLRRRR